MLRIVPLLLLTLLLAPTLTHAAMQFDEDHQKQAADAINAAIESHQTPGAVLLVGTKDGVLFKQAYGHRAFEPEDQAAKPMTVDTIFDLASLSKSIGCATSIMVLADEGKLKVTDPVSKYIRAAAPQPDKKEITIEQCLLHRAGFIPDNPMSDYENCTHEQMIEHLFGRKLKYEPGTDCVYADLSFIVLGEVVKSVSGEGLDVFAKKHVFEPAGMKDTSYLPPASWKDRIAPTQERDGHWMIGEVHDPRAWALGGYAGHAGVFGTADDIGRWCRMLLNHGEIDGQRIFSAKIASEMTKCRYMPDGKNGRGYGVDFTTAYSPAPRGNRFELGTTYGHTGYTGTSYWIDPVHGCFYVLLTNRVNPDDKATVTPLRRKVATIVGEALLGPKKEN